MVSIVVLGDMSPYKTYWSALYEKYKNDVKYQFIYVDERFEGLEKAKHDIVFFTESYAIPTYETMTLLPELGSNELDPVWHEYNNKEHAGKTCECSWTVRKSKYRNESRESYLENKTSLRTKMYSLINL